MFQTNLTIRSRLLSRVAVVALISGLAAGCSSGVERFGEPIYTGGTQNQQAILGTSTAQPSYNDILASSSTLPAGSGQVQRGALPPASSAVPILSAQAAQPVPLYTGSIPTRRSAGSLPRAQAASAPRGERGWSTVGGTAVTLGRDESVQSVSRRYGVPVSAIQTANGLSGDAATPMPGQRLIIPTYNSGASVSAGSLPPRPLNTATNVLPVRTKTMRVASNANIVPDSKPVRPRVVALTAAPKSKPVTTGSIQRTAKVPVAAPSKPRAVASRPVQTSPLPDRKTPSENQITRLSPDQQPRTTASVSNDAQAGDGEANRFRWPVRGRVISTFGRKAGGTRNDGINLAVPEGTQVRSVESGTVIYAGNELKGYGKLVLIRHEDGWVSAYAHNSELKVNRGDTVRRGDVVANAGSTGSVSQPQLHFELRRGNKPVDPLQYLSKV